MNPFLRYLADKHSAHRHTDRHTPMTTRPCGLTIKTIPEPIGELLIKKRVYLVFRPNGLDKFPDWTEVQIRTDLKQIFKT